MIPVALPAVPGDWPFPIAFGLLHNLGVIVTSPGGFFGVAFY
jgi:hypothetical protein